MAKYFCQVGDRFLVKKKETVWGIPMTQGAEITISRLRGDGWWYVLCSEYPSIIDYVLEDSLIKRKVMEEQVWERIGLRDSFENSDNFPRLCIGKRFGIDPTNIKPTKKEPYKTIRRLAGMGLDFKVMRVGEGRIEINTTHGNWGPWIFTDESINAIRRKG